MALEVHDPDGRLEPALVAAMVAADIMFPDIGLVIQHYTRRTQRSIGRNPLGRISANDPSIPQLRRRRSRLQRKYQRQSKTIYRVDEWWEALYEWGLLTPHWRTYWIRRQAEGKAVPRTPGAPLSEKPLTSDRSTG